MWFYDVLSRFVDGFSQEKNVLSAGWVGLLNQCNVNFTTVKLSSPCLDIKWCHFIQFNVWTFSSAFLLVIPMRNTSKVTGYHVTELILESSIIFNHGSPIIVNNCHKVYHIFPFHFIQKIFTPLKDVFWSEPSLPNE